MKKFLKIFAIIFGLALLTTIVVCYMAMPQRTKELGELIIHFLNTPIAIIGGTTITVGLVTCVVIKLIFDRYRNNIKKELKLVREDNYNKYQASVKEKEEAIKQKEEVLAILKDYSNKIDNLSDLLIKVCETSPNVKIKAIGEYCKEHKDDYKQEIKEKLIEIDNQIVEPKQSNKEIALLSQELGELKKRLEEMESNGHGKE